MGSDLEETNRAFTVRSSGSIGQEIVDPDGVVICWTVDPWLAQVIAHLLEMSDREGLLGSPSAQAHRRVGSGRGCPGQIRKNEMSAKIKYVVRESGIEEIFLSREFCVEVPSDVVDVQAWLDEHHADIAGAADDADVAWIAENEWQGVPDETIDIICDGDEPEDWHPVVDFDLTN